jgi:colanic acid biosynthesis glycosyl transferase WcaI
MFLVEAQVSVYHGRNSRVVGNGYSASHWRREKWQGLDVWRCPLWIPAKPSRLKRLLYLTSFMMSSFPVMLWQVLWRPDIVLVVQPPLFCAPQALLTAWLSGAKALLHIQDYEVDAAFDLGLLKGQKLRSFANRCEGWLMRRFDRVSTISQRMLERAVAKGVAEDRALLFPNWVDLTRLPQDHSRLGAYRRRLNIDAEAVVALYSGNMGGKQGLDILAKAAMVLAAEHIVFVLCGNGSGREELMLLCRDLQNVRFLDLQPKERFLELLAMADIHLLPQLASAADLVMPSKLTGMLASGRPVVATAHQGTELATVVACCGLVVEPEQPQAFADAILKLAQDPVLRNRLGSAGRAYAEVNFDRDAVLGRFYAEIRSLSKGNVL